MLHWCAQFSYIGLLGTESDHHNSNDIPKINFCVYQNIACFTVYCRLYFNEKKQLQLYEFSTDSIINAKLYSKNSLP